MHDRAVTCEGFCKRPAAGVRSAHDMAAREQDPRDRGHPHTADTDDVDAHYPHPPSASTARAIVSAAAGRPAAFAFAAIRAARARYAGPVWCTIDARRTSRERPDCVAVLIRSEPWLPPVTSTTGPSGGSPSARRPSTFVQRRSDPRTGLPVTVARPRGTAVMA